MSDDVEMQEECGDDDDELLARKIRIISIGGDRPFGEPEVVLSPQKRLGKRQADSRSNQISFKEYHERKRDIKYKTKQNLPILSKS